MPNLYIERQIKPLFLKWLQKPEVVFLTGARQVGKTTFLKKISHELEDKGEQVTFTNIEEANFRQRAQQDPFRFIQELTAKGGKRHFLFIDEFQKVPELLEAIKVYYDQDSKHKTKFVLSGSAGVITRRRGEESLLGRSIRLNLFSFSWLEFNQAKGIVVSENESLKALLLGSGKDYQPFANHHPPFFDEYLLWGGFPRVVLETDETSKLTLYENIKQAFLEKDIQALIREEQLMVFEQLMEMLAARCGQLISFSSLASDLTIAPQTVRHLSFLLKHSYWLDLVYPTAKFGSGYKKSPKVYFHDLGFRHSLLRWLMLPRDPLQMGAIAENLVFKTLTRLLAYDPSFAGKIYFWQTYDGAEVDFVLEMGQRLVGIEVKYQRFKKPSLSRGPQNFIKKYQPDLFLVITREGHYQDQFKKTPTLFVPLPDFAKLI